MNIAVGIGAYGIRVAIQNNGKVEMVKLGDSLSPYIIPSLAYVAKSGQIILGNLAELCDINNGERVYLSEMMPSDNKAEDIYEKLFAFIKDHIVSLYKQTVSNVTMIVPPYFQSVDPRKKVMREAWMHNGIYNLDFISSDVSTCYRKLNLSNNESALVFADIRYSSIDEPEYYFNAFWQVYTWNTLLLCPEFVSIKEQSELCDYVKPLTGALYAKEAIKRIDGLIEKGVSTLISIEKDILKINELLQSSGKRLFVLYDRLDTCINPLRWDKAVSPLINYWWNNCESFSNISPKIFVRTDLFRLIEGTNTGRLESSIIHIEWTIGEVFGFFFKLIFSDKNASEAYWAIAKKVSIDDSYINNTKKRFEKFPKNQFNSLSRAEMDPIIKVFFGSSVKVGAASLGTPWEYFEKELANADNTAICLRPFINTLNTNAVDKALARTEKYVRNGIISPEIYASKSVRDEATERYFSDLTQDAFSKDLARFKEVIRTSIGEPYRFKSLSESQFEELIDLTFSRISESEVVKSTDDLKRLIFANGIIARKVTTKGCYYRFAPIYWYSWGLVNSVLEKEERKRTNLGGDKNVGTITINARHEKVIKTKAYPYPLKIENCDIEDLYENEIVEFVTKSRPNDKNPDKDYRYATDVKQKKTNDET